MAVSNLAYSNSQACDICNITTYLVLLRILLQLPESTPFLATTQKPIYIKALCRGGGLSNNRSGCQRQCYRKVNRVDLAAKRTYILGCFFAAVVVSRFFRSASG